MSGGGGQTTWWLSHWGPAFESMGSRAGLAALEGLYSI
jgi:hypothetical protein